MQLTSNYKLKKPETNEYYNVEDFNENADIIDRTLKKAIEAAGSHAKKHAADGEDPLTPAMIGAASVQIGGTEPTAPYTLWFNTGDATSAIAMLSLDEDAAGTAVAAIVDGTEYGVENATVNAAPTTGSYDFTII